MQSTISQYANYFSTDDEGQPVLANYVSVAEATRTAQSMGLRVASDLGLNGVRVSIAGANDVNFVNVVVEEDSRDKAFRRAFGRAFNQMTASPSESPRHAGGSSRDAEVDGILSDLNIDLDDMSAAQMVEVADLACRVLERVIERAKQIA